MIQAHLKHLLTHQNHSDLGRDTSQHLPDRSTLFPACLFTQRSANASSKVLRERKLELLYSYLPDWILTIIVAVGFILLDQIDGHQREFDVNDPAIQFSYTDEVRISVPMLAVLSGVLPATFVVLCSQLLLRSSWDTHTGLLGLGLSHCLSFVMTTIIKLATGRPRPDFLARCKPWVELINQGPTFFRLRDSSICSVSSDSKIVRDGFRSFPSGHASTAWAGLGFLSFYMAGKLHLSDPGGHTIKLWIPIVPSFAAGFIAITRTMDNRHHWQDIFAGSLIGLTSAWCSYRFYYPILSSKKSHQPYPPRLKSTSRNDEGSSVPDNASFPP